MATRTTTVDVRASALASWQLVEDARYRSGGNDRRREHLRAVAGRAVADRRLARDQLARNLSAGLLAG